MEIEFTHFYEWVKFNLGIDLFAYKEKQLQRRILTIMKTTGATNLKEYSQLIKNNKQIRQEFLDYITINVTEFFRNPELFLDLEQLIKLDLLPEFKELKIWSAACSIGCEPYSLGIMTQREKIPLKTTILATDIDLTILKKAKAGIYKANELKNVKPHDLVTYFSERDEQYHINSAIKQLVHFKQHDLLQDKYGKDFHLIVCRNVTIYFKPEARDAIYRKFNDALVMGGIFFTGATETISNPETFGFKKLSTFMYQKIS
ncbi:chemotaxis protein CheR [Vagococcus penaei]|uniref:CheR family methyltransferase n=1 Tax=Vagococcus penaei TaxID=633807 RepID=UPI0009859E31|nr:protein-glutamate O-methyltransferase CheR [Vagococcus penaei]RSU06816.1 chemotaxis protein CheR [Vagococcus penaei]